MKSAQSVKQQIAKTLLCSVLASSFCSQAVQANDNVVLENIKALKIIEFSKTLKASHIEMTKEAYLDQAKAVRKHGFGAAVDNKSFSWGFNHRGLSILKTF